MHSQKRARITIALLIAVICYLIFLGLEFQKTGVFSWFSSQFASTAIVTFFGSSLGFFSASMLKLDNQNADEDISIKTGRLSHEIERAEILIENNAMKPVGRESKFNAEFASRLEEYDYSVHVAILTPSGIEHYKRNEVLNKWGKDMGGFKRRYLNKDESERAKRRRIVVIPSDEAHGEIRGDNELLSFFQNTAEVKFVEGEHLLAGERSNLFKDCAVFFDPTNDKHSEKKKRPIAYLSYCPRGHEWRFAKVPSINFRLDDIGECEAMLNLFDEVWSDKIVTERSRHLFREFTESSS